MCQLDASKTAAFQLLRVGREISGVPMGDSRPVFLPWVLPGILGSWVFAGQSGPHRRASGHHWSSLATAERPRTAQRRPSQHRHERRPIALRSASNQLMKNHRSHHIQPLRLPCGCGSGRAGIRGSRGGVETRGLRLRRPPPPCRWQQPIHPAGFPHARPCRVTPAQRPMTGVWPSARVEGVIGATPTRTAESNLRRRRLGKGGRDWRRSSPGRSGCGGSTGERRISTVASHH